MSANIDAVLARLDEMNNGEINYEVYRELHDLVSAIEDDVQAPIELFPGTLEALDALSIRARTTSPDAATELRRGVTEWAKRFIPGDRWDTEDLRDLESALNGNVEANPDRRRARSESAEAERGAATEAKQPEGWSTEDRREAKCEAERRWSRPVEREVDQQRQSGTINGFILGAEWQKARETFISFRSIADEARTERDAALAAIERVKETLSLHNPNGRLVKEVLAALDGGESDE